MFTEVARAAGTVQVVGCLLSEHRILGSTLSIASDIGLGS